MGFCAAYTLVCIKMKDSTSEPIRLGIAGSIASMACECCFHIIDTINIRMKVKTCDPKAK